MKRCLMTMCFVALAVIGALAQEKKAVPPPPKPLGPVSNGQTSAQTAVSGTTFAVVNIEQAVSGTKEGQSEFEALRKELEPKQTELKYQNDDLEGYRKQLQTQGDKLTEDARASLIRRIEIKKKSFDRAVQDFQKDAQNQQKEISQRILQKMAPVIVKQAQDGGFSMILDTSNPWPKNPVLWFAPSGDITKAIVDAYDNPSHSSAQIAAVGTTFAVINVEQLVVGTKEAQQRFAALNKEIAPGQNDLQARQTAIFGEILQKMAPGVVEYAGHHGYGLILDTSKPWPQSNMLWFAPSVDVTKAIVDAYDDPSHSSAQIAAGGTTFAVINVEQAIAGTKEGQQRFAALSKGAREDAVARQNTITQEILQKMAPILVKYANDYGYGMVLDTSKAWPQSNLLWSAASADITKAIVGAYDGPPPCNELDQVVQIDPASGLASGPGHCTGEADFWFTNTSVQAIDCAIIFHKNGRFDFASVFTFTLAPGDKSGGPGKISTCGADCTWSSPAQSDGA